MDSPRFASRLLSPASQADSHGNPAAAAAAADADASTAPPSSSSSSALDEKALQITAACRDRDVNALIRLATVSDGLVNDDLRRTAWPILLGCSHDAPEQQGAWNSLPPHRDEHQVGLDVKRSFVNYPTGESGRQLEKRKEELSDVITEVLRRHPALCYFQGYHDIVQVLLLVLGFDKARSAVARLSLLRIRDFMLHSLEGATSHLHLVHPILYTVDPALHKQVSQTQPFFALSATLTLYAHEIEEYGAIARLFDFFLAREAVIPIYFFAVVILARKDELLEISIDDPDMLHFTLSKLPKPLDIELLISQTISLFESHPPESLPWGTWRRISSNSVLKTTRTPSDVTKQSIEEGETWFAKQEVEVYRKEAIRKVVVGFRKQVWLYRRPASAFGLALAVGIVAWWMGKNGGMNSRFNGTGSLGESIKRMFAMFV